MVAVRGQGVADLVLGLAGVDHEDLELVAIEPRPPRAMGLRDRVEAEEVGDQPDPHAPAMGARLRRFHVLRIGGRHDPADEPAVAFLQLAIVLPLIVEIEVGQRADRPQGELDVVGARQVQAVFGLLEVGQPSRSPLQDLVAALVDDRQREEAVPGRRGMPRLQLVCLPEGADPLLRPVHPHQGEAELEMGLDAVRLQLPGLFQRPHRLVVFSRVVQRAAQGNLGAVAVGPDGGGAAIVSDRLG